MIAMTATTSPTQAVALYESACDVFNEKIHLVRADHWELPTPCTEWNVRQLINHVTVEDMWAPHLLAGRTMADIGNALDGDMLGSDPVRTWDTAVAEAREAARAPGAAQATVHLSYGDDTASSYLMQLFADHLIHSWDLATSVGADQRLPEDLVAACQEWFTRMEPVMRQAGLIGPRPPVPPDVDAQARLLAAYGRRADATPRG
jgi:uncharacterized protein (TIGR03086 family)